MDLPGKQMGSGVELLRQLGAACDASEDWSIEWALVQKENICILCSLTNLSSSALALSSRFKDIPGGIFHWLEMSKMKKEHFMTWVEKNKDKCFLFVSYPQPTGGISGPCMALGEIIPCPFSSVIRIRYCVSQSFVCVGAFTRTRRHPRSNWKPGEHSMRKELIPRDMLVCLPSLS